MIEILTIYFCVYGVLLHTMFAFINTNEGNVLPIRGAILK